VAALRRATAVSAVSASTAAEISAAVGRDIHVIENAIDLPPSVDISDLSLPSHFSLVISRLTPEKNVQTVIDAYNADVAAALGPLVVVGGGAGSYSSDYQREMIANSGREVLWLGHQSRERALSVLRLADRVISASTLEAQPMAILEAHALGKDLLLSDIPAHHEVAGNDAVYFDCLDSAGLRDHLLYMENSRRRVGVRSRWNERTWADVAKEYLSWFEKHLDVEMNADATVIRRHSCPCPSDSGDKSIRTSDASDQSIGSSDQRVL